MENNENEGILDAIKKDEYFQTLIEQLNPECREYVSQMVENMVTNVEQSLREALRNF